MDKPILGFESAAGGFTCGAPSFLTTVVGMLCVLSCVHKAQFVCNAMFNR